METDMSETMNSSFLASIEDKKRELDKLRPLPKAIVQKLNEQFI